MVVEICICYTHEDEWLRKELEKQFSVLVQQNLAIIWHEGKIAGGTEWKQAITMHIQTAQIILLLLSPDFIASEHYFDITLALQRHTRKEARVVPIILRSVDWQLTPLRDLKVLPTNRVPVTLWQDRDQAWLHIVQMVSRIVAEIGETLFASHDAEETLLSDNNADVVQKVIAEGEGHIEDISQESERAGNQTVSAKDKSVIRGVKQNIKYPPSGRNALQKGNMFSDDANSEHEASYQISIGKADGIAIGNGASVNNGISAEELIKMFREHNTHTATQPEQRSLHMADVLLVTVTEIETKAILEVFSASTRCFIDEKTYYDFGAVSGARIYMMRSEMGIGGPGGASLTIAEGIKVLCPSSVIMVGIAFGMRQEQHIGELLVSRQIMEYELQRVSTHVDGQTYILPRGDRVSASIRLLDRFRDAALSWQGKKIHFGLLLSGAKLVDSQEFKKHLQAIEPEAIGGEMEGAGLYAAAQRSKVDWILVKGICDWADGNKQRNKIRYQQQAASQAAQFTLHVIQQGGFLRAV